MRSNFRIGLVCAGLVLAGAAPLADAAECNLTMYAELPIRMMGTRPMLAAKVNGMPVTLLADSGATFVHLSRESAEKMGLRLRDPPQGYNARGIGGSQRMWLAKVKELTIDGWAAGAIRNFDVEVTDTPTSTFGGDGLIGQSILGSGDAEYDLAKGMIRLFHPTGCEKRSLAYWAGNASVGIVEIGRRTPLRPHIIGPALLNTTKIQVIFDTGANRSMLDLDAAERAGTTPEEDGVAAAGWAGGIGHKMNATYTARFDMLDLGGEQIKNARLLMVDFPTLAKDADMLLGADFFLSHRVFVANSQSKVYFTYNGGRVFDLGAAAKSAAATGLAPNVAAGEGPALPPTSPKESLTAAEYKRRGAASMGRQDFSAAISDFDEAIKLDATDADTFHQRGTVRLQTRQPMMAMSDFDAALKLNPDSVAALMDRGRLRLGAKNVTAASEDFDKVAKLAVNEPGTTLRIAQTYMSATQFEEAVKRYDQWLIENPKDPLTGTALNGRCWSRAMLGNQLDLALADCNAALKKGPVTSRVYDARAMVQLRMGNTDAAMKDYKESLKLETNTAYALYGLGVTEIKKGRQAEGETHQQTALKISPTAGDVFKRTGVAP